MAPSSCIAYQGQPGAYSHLACMGVYPELEPLPCESFEDAFQAVEEGRCKVAMIPIENNLGGRVADVHHLLPESSLYIVGEHFHPVKHCLLAPRGATLEGLESVSSHVQALAQCRRLIRELGLGTIVCSDTAGAAREIAERGDPTQGAIASWLAAEVYGLEVLRTCIEDRPDNTTRFVVMSRRREEPDPRAGASMTSLVFRVRSVPGALYKALGGFAANDINIIKLESYMTDASFTVAQFYVEIEGHPAERNVANAFEELRSFSSTLRVLGTYPRHPFRGA